MNICIDRVCRFFARFHREDYGCGARYGVAAGIYTLAAGQAIVAIGDSLADSVLATMNLKELGVPKVVCKAYDETHRRVMLKLGADQVVIPEQEIAARLARSMTSGNVLDYIELSEDYGIIEVPAPKKWIGKTLKELDVRAKMGINIIAIERDEKISAFPAGDYCFTEGDVIVVLGDTATMNMVQKL